MNNLAIENLSKVFAGPDGKEAWALRDASLEVRPGELLVLLGPSGSGKTTLLRIVAGLEEPSVGRVVIGGRDVTALAPEDRDLSMVFQDPVLYPHMTLSENLAFGLRLRKVPRAEIGTRVEEIAELLGLKPLLDRHPSALSGGERQRAALGRALVLRPKALLLDEPFSSLDVPLRAELRRELVLLQRRSGTTMLYVTHDQQEAMALGQRLAVIRAGCIEQTGSPLEVYRSPANRFVASFLGSPPMNWFAGELNADGILQLAMPDGKGRSGRKVAVGLRPEHLRLIHENGTLAPLETRVPGQVETVETLGWASQVWLRTEFGLCVMRVTPETQVRAGETLWLAADLARGCILDPETEKRIETRTSQP